MKSNRRVPAKFARKMLPAAVAVVFGHASWAGINDGGNTANLPTGGVATNPANVTSATLGANSMSIGISGRAVIDWATFNVGSGYALNFSGAGGAVLNRVPLSAPASGTLNSSTIAGSVNAPGVAVMLMNPNGIAFTSTAVVNVGALVATTGTINEGVFTSTGNAAITGATAGITNHGQITASGQQITMSNAGLVALVAPSVANHGVISAVGGKILLAGAEAATVSMNGGLYEFAVNQGAANSLVANTGTLTTAAASGSVTGTIVLSAPQLEGVVSGAINLAGIQRASRIEVHGGIVELKSDLNAATVAGSSSMVNVSKTSSGGGQVQDGVSIAKSGGTVNVGEGTFAESVTIDRALTLDGAGKGKTIINPGSNATGILVTGNIGAGATVTISDLTVQGGGIGIKVADFTTLGTITLDGLAVRDNSSQGFISNNGGSNPTGVSNINILNSVFAGNGVGPGSADINLFRFNGNATIKNVDILGTRGSASNLAAATDYGLQIRGQGEVGNLTAAGVVKLENVRIAGNYRRAHLGIQRYSDASSITMSGVQLGGSLLNVAVGNSATVSVPGSSAGFGKFFSSDERGALSLGDTKFFASAAESNPLDISIGTQTDGLRVDAAGTKFFDHEGHQRTDNFAIERRVQHAMDASALGGVVTWQAGNLYVTNDRSIQRGIDVASASDTVHVEAGTFAEQLRINKSLVLVGAGDQTIISPTSLTADSLGMKSILTIGGGPTTSVEVSGFMFKGPVPELNAGIFVRDGAHAHIHDNTLIDMRESAALSGNQRGIGIFVGRASLGTSGTALIEDNYISGYQKGGIVVDGPGSLAIITGNTVIGEGPTNRIAQNGIQASRGASAHIEGNTVRGNDYTRAGDEATGILIFTPGANLAQGEITVGPNSVSDNEVGIWTNDPRSLTRIELDGVSGNARNAVADFGGGFAGQANLEYPAWAAANAATVSPGSFGGKESGDMVDLGGALRVTGWSGFTAIQPAVNAVAAGASIEVASGTYAESVVLNGPRNLTFNDVTLQDLTINTGAAGSGIRGSVTATGSTGFLFNALVHLLGDTSLATTGANIVFNSDIQGFGGNPYALSLNAGTGNVTLVSGGTASNPLGSLFVASNDFTLLDTLWVSGYDINAVGAVALSGHTLRSVGAGAVNEITAGGDVTGSTTAESPIGVQSGGSVDIVVNTPAPVEVHADGPANVAGSAPSLIIDAPSGSVSGDFAQVTNTGSGLIDVNGTPQLNTRLAESVVNYDRVIPVDITTAASPDAGNTPHHGKVRRRKAEDAAEVLENGESLEIDLSPGN
jgi:filamentous hemagglutinin family protein